MIRTIDRHGRTPVRSDAAADLAARFTARFGGTPRVYRAPGRVNSKEGSEQMKKGPALLMLLVVFVAGFGLGNVLDPTPVAAQAGGRVFELRTYTASEGKLDALHARFRDHTLRIFQKHGMTNVGYWSPQDAPLAQNTLVYILAHSSREAAKKSWDAFRQDPEWQKAQKESEVNGRLTAKVESVFMNATDYSPMK
jgi:hypothetical protein